MEKIGKTYKLFTLIINGVKYYFIGSIKHGGFRWVFNTSEPAIKTFKKLEKG